MADTRSPTTWLTKDCPRFRASTKTSSEPSSTAAKVRKKDSQVPNITPPTRAVILLGMGASTTERNCTRKKHR